MSPVPQPEPTTGDTSWFVHDRFGMFIHWGTYAAAACHEWVKFNEGMDDESYQRYFDHFDPDLYDPEAWAKAAADAGMKYVVLTTKHHEGFCLWDTQQTKYKATNTPYGRDLLRPFVDAFRAQGLKVGFYYSLLDWHHPDFPIDAVHPQGGGQVVKLREGIPPDFSFGKLLNQAADLAEQNKTRDVRRYAAYMREQVRELLTGYGPVDIIWYDFSYPEMTYGGVFEGKGKDQWESEELLALTRELQPDIIVNNRLDLPNEKADVHTPEQFQPRAWFEVDGKPVVWETCQTFSGSWGYHRDETSWKSPEQLVQMLVKSVSTGGNLLMNVGPTARGTFDDRALDALRVFGDWMRLHARSIYGCTQSSFTPPPDCRYTQNGDRLYLHVFAWPFKQLFLDDLAGKVAYAQLLNDASEIKFFEPGEDEWNRYGTAGGALELALPVQKPNAVVPIIELFLK